jgi:integrase
MTAASAPTASGPRIRPLDEVEPPEGLDGSQGFNRAPLERAQIAAQNDVEALRLFLQEYDKSAGTLRVYQKECERFFLWSWFQRLKAVSDLVREDFEAYIDFLKDPQPAEIWCGAKAPKETDRWRPFVGPLDLKAVQTTLAALNSMMSWFVDAGYLSGNPLGLIRQKLKKAGATTDASRADWQPDVDAKVERFLDDEMWDAVTAAVESLPQVSDEDKARYERLRFVCALLYLLAPRAGELERQRMNSFREERGLWWWYVHGKGDKKAKIPVPDDMMEALVRYRTFLELSAVPSPTDQTPLLVSLKRPKAAADSSSSTFNLAAKPGRSARASPLYQPITARQLNYLLKELFNDAANRLPPRASHKRDKLRAASAHWGRHTSITSKIDSGVDPRYAQKDARHADPRTTGMYTHEDEYRWHQESQKQRLRWGSSSGH